MAAKLKGLKITSTDLVGQGANPDAYVLFKRKRPVAAREVYMHMRKIAGEIDDVLKSRDEAKTFDENIEREGLQKSGHRSAATQVASEMRVGAAVSAYDFCCAFSDSLWSIIDDTEQDETSKRDMMFTSLEEFTECIRDAIPNWALAEKADCAEPIAKSAAQQESNVPDNGESPKKEETDTMKIDKSKMTAEELTALADFEKRYGAEDEPVAATGAATPPDEIIKDTAPSGGHVELHPEVKKALAELDAIKKANEELTKSLEMERLTAIAKKYEVIGKKTDELAPKLYGLKKAGGTVYADYVALLDENVATVEKSGLFGAIGSDASGTADTVDKIGIAAKEITKSANVGNAAAIVKAWEDNPELAAAYEKEYLGGVN